MWWWNRGRFLFEPTKQEKQEIIRKEFISNKSKSQVSKRKKFKTA